MHSLLPVQVGEQICSCEINENLVEVPVVRVIPHYRSKCHKKAFEGVLVKGSSTLQHRGIEHFVQLCYIFLSEKQIYLSCYRD